MDIWQETQPVRFHLVDCSDRLSLAEVFNFFQEAAISHAENLGVGRDSMAQTGQVWILSRISVQIDRRPRYGESITIRTWPRGGEKLFALRDYDVRNARDIPVIRGRSGWLVVDLEKHRPLRPQSIMEKLPLNDGLDALPGGAAGLKEQQNLQKIAERTAAYSDLDYNNHVNNVRYIQWIQDALDPQLLVQAGQMRLDINFLNEIFPGEVTGIWSAPLADAADTAACSRPPDKALAFEGRKAESGQAAFRAELRLWNNEGP